MTADISDSHANNESNLQDPSASPPRVPDHWTFLSVTIYEPTPPPIANRVEYLSRLEKNLADCPVEVQHSAAKQFHKHITRGPKPTSENAIATAAERAKRIRWKVKHGKDIGKRQTEPQLRKDLGHKLCEKERTRASYAEKLRWRRGGRVDMGKLRLWYDLTLKRSKRLGVREQFFTEEWEQLKVYRNEQIKRISRRVETAKDGGCCREKLIRINQLGQLVDKVYEEKINLASEMVADCTEKAEMAKWLIDNP